MTDLKIETTVTFTNETGEEEIVSRLSLGFESAGEDLGKLERYVKPQLRKELISIEF